MAGGWLFSDILHELKDGLSFCCLDGVCWRFMNRWECVLIKKLFNRVVAGFFGTQDRVHFSRLLGFIFQYRRRLVFALLAVVGVASTEAMLAMFMQPLIDVGFSSTAAKAGVGAFTSISQSVWTTSAKIWLVPLILVGLFIFRGTCRFVSGYQLSWVAAQVLSDLRSKMFTRMLLLPSRYQQQHPSAHMSNKFLLDAGTALGLASDVFLVLTRDTLTVIGLIGILLYLNWQLALIMTVTFPLLAVLSRYYRGRLRTLTHHAQGLNQDLAHVLQESYDGHKVVKLFGGQTHAKTRFEAVNAKILYYAKRLASAASAKSPISELISSLALAVVIFVVLWQSEQGLTTVGGFIAFIVALLQMMSPLKNLSNLSAPMQRMLVAAESVFQLIDEPIEPNNGKTVIARTNGDLRFDKVDLIYDGQQQKALDAFDLHIRAGEKIALVGRSGSGKTSLINLLPRFVDASAGAIYIDGVALADVELNSLRAQFSLVSQDVILFNDSLYNNVAYGKFGATDAEVETAIRAANLWEFVEQQPEGWHVNVGNNGNKLSGGQRQRLSIARAILKDAPILILDEATSALDNESERLVQQALDRLMHNRTAIIIAHRLSTVEQCNRIVVMSHGKIIEVGSHSELLAQKGAYAQLSNQPTLH